MEKRQPATRAELVANLEKEVTARLPGRLRDGIPLTCIVPVHLGRELCNWLLDDRTLRKRILGTDWDVMLEIVTDAMRKYALEETTGTDEPECWMFFFPGSSYPERRLLDMEPIEDYPSVEAAKAEFVRRINGADPRYPNVDDKAFAYIFIKALQERTPQSKLWWRDASINVTLKVGLREGRFREVTVETGHENEKRLRPHFWAYVKKCREAAKQRRE